MGWKINKAPVGLLIYVEEFRILVNFFLLYCSDKRFRRDMEPFSQNNKSEPPLKHADK